MAFETERLRVARRQAKLGCAIEFHAEIDSTSTRARVLARGGAAEGTTVIADAQSAGRGRLGRTWVSPAGRNLYLSIVLRPQVPIETVPQLTLVAGLSVARAVGEWLPQVRIKWPNDIMVAGRKLGGILTEMEAANGSVAFVVLGIGVNLNLTASDLPPELRDKAASVAMFLPAGEAVDRVSFAERLLAHLERDYEVFVARGFAPLRSDWNQVSVLTGSRVRVDTGGTIEEGHVEGLADDGTLRLRASDGRTVHIVAGDVRVIDGYGAATR